jgi:hypothetical protein
MCGFWDILVSDPKMNHDGIVFQVAVAAGSFRAASVTGR